MALGVLCAVGTVVRKGCPAGVPDHVLALRASDVQRLGTSFRPSGVRYQKSKRDYKVSNEVHTHVNLAQGSSPASHDPGRIAAARQNTATPRLSRTAARAQMEETLEFLLADVRGPREIRWKTYVGSDMSWWEGSRRGDHAWPWGEAQLYSFVRGGNWRVRDKLSVISATEREISISSFASLRVRRLLKDLRREIAAQVKAAERDVSRGRSTPRGTTTRVTPLNGASVLPSRSLAARPESTAMRVRQRGHTPRGLGQ